MPAPIGSAKNTPLNVATGTIPNLGGALLDWFQPMVFSLVTKENVGGEAVETMVEIKFRGVIQPLTNRELVLKPEGQRAWSWFMLHAQPDLELTVDSVVNYLGRQTRIMAKKNYEIYGYILYELVQDWTGAGPTPVVP